MVCDLPRHRLNVLAISGEGLIERSRLDNTLVGELLVRRRIDRQTGRRAFPARCARRLAGGLEQVAFGISRCVVSCDLVAFLACFNDSALLLPNVHAPLQLLAHVGIMSVEARRKAGETKLLQDQSSAFFRGQRTARDRP